MRERHRDHVEKFVEFTSIKFGTIGKPDEKTKSSKAKTLYESMRCGHVVVWQLIYNEPRGVNPVTAFLTILLVVVVVLLQ